MQNNEISNWVKAVLKKSGISYARASKELGLPPDAISKVTRGERDLSAAEMAQIASLVGQPVPSGNLATGTHPRYVNVVGEVAAGLWREVSIETFKSYKILTLLEDRWPDDGLFGFLIVGDSINLKAQDGDHVVVLSIEYAPRHMQSGDWVVVDRIRHDLRERTVKQARQSDAGEWELWPRSNDPEHVTPLQLGDHDDERVEVVGFVLEFISRGVRF